MPEDGEQKSSELTAKDPADDDEERDEEAVAPRAKASPKKADDDADDDDADDDEADDEDDDDEADEEEESPPPPPPKKAVARAAPARDRDPKPNAQRRPPAARAQLPPENQIGAPSSQTLVLLGVMAFSTLAMWGSARFACNAHPAQTRKPRDVTTAELGKDPKDAALEMQQRWNSYDFKGALELAKGPVAEELQKAEAECEKNASDCESKRKAQKDKVLATAALLTRGPGSAKVRVVSRGGATGEQTTVYALEQEGATWKVSQKGATPDPVPAPTPTLAPQPTPSVSVAPPGPATAPSAGFKPRPVAPKTAPKAPPANP
jgi:hypothetical protein